MSSRLDTQDEWKANWLGSVAIKVTAPIMWLTVLVGAIAAILFNDVYEERLHHQLTKEADQIAFNVSQLMSKTSILKVSTLQDGIQHILEDTLYHYAELSVKQNSYTAGEKQQDFESVVRGIYASIYLDDPGKNTLRLELHHQPFSKLLIKERKALLLKLGLPLLLFCLCVAWLVQFVVARPINDLLTATKAVTEGNMDVELESKRVDEFGLLVGYFDRMVKSLKSKQAELEHSAELAEQANKAKSKFLANMSHEIRTPLTAIIGFSDMLRDDFDLANANEDVKHVVDTISRAGVHLQEIINDILDLSKIEAEQLVIEHIATPLFEVLSDVDELICIKAKEKSLEFKLEFKFPLPRYVTTDPTRLRQILLNLCSNAIKFSKTGTVSVQVALDQGQNQLLLDVVDQGIGMNKEELLRLFKPFSQADSSTTREYGGTGLGLCISKQLAQKLGGDLSCESVKDSGSRFSLSIDAGPRECQELIYAPVELAASEREFAQIDQPRNLSGRVLVVEDTPDNQRLISMYIKRTGATPIVVENGKLAVEAAMKQDFNLVFMDIQMPVMDGLTAIRQLRQRGYVGPIVALTANAMKEDREECINAGADDYLTKPVDVNRFNKLLSGYLDERPSACELEPNQQDMDLAKAGDEEELQELIALFLAELPARLRKIQQAHADRDWVSLQSRTHQLKGIGSSFGFPQVTRIADEVNSSTKAQELEKLDARMAELTQVCQGIIDNHKPIQNIAV